MQQVYGFAAFLLFVLLATAAIAYQVNTGTSGTNPMVKSYPSGLTTTYATTGNTSINGSLALNGVGGITSAQMSPAIAATTNGLRVDVDTGTCPVAVFRCSDRGTVTITFNKPVTNPVLHISGLGGNIGTNITMYHASLNLTGWTGPSSSVTLSRTAGNTNFTVNSTEIRATTINGGTSCTTAPLAGCGSVRVNGTVSSLTFRVDALMGGTTNPWEANSTPPFLDAFTITTTVDDDYSDSPAAYQTAPMATHVVGGAYMGAGVSADGASTLYSATSTTSPVVSTTASADGNDDGVTFPTMVWGRPNEINVAVTGSGGYLQGWIDWAADNSYNTAGDRIATNIQDGGTGDLDGAVNGNIRLSVTAPAGTAQANRFARFRWSTTASLSWNGAASDGEVEDYQITVYPQRNDLSLTKTVSNASPAPGASLSYTLTLTSAAMSPTSNTPTTGVTVQDTLPAGFTFVSASGTGTYNNGTGVWTVGTVSPGDVATLTINGTATNSPTTTVTNIAQVRTSSITDPDSTVNNGVTTEDDYATVSFTTAAIFNCPTGSTSTGSGYATGGTGAYQNQIFWLDWTCGGVTNYPAGSTINKSWDAGDGLVITGQVTNITFGMTPYTTGAWGGDMLDDMYPGVNPIGLRGTNDGEDPQFRVVYSATLNGVPVPLNYAIADAESSDGAAEGLAGTTNGTNWTLLEQQGALNVALAGSSFTMSDTANAGNGSAIVYTSGSTVQIDATITQGGLQAMAFGVWTPFDYSDAPLTGTSYGAANHRTIGNYILGASVTSEAAAYDTPNANGDSADNGVVTTPNFLRGQTATVNVSVQGLGYLSGWIDFNDDGDWADAGEKVATDLRDGGAGDLDGAVNGNVRFQVAVPAGAALTPTIARLRYSSRTGAPTTGLWGFGEVEDYQITIQNAELTLAKTSTVVSDPINGTTNPKRLPGATVRYCILTTNVGTATASNVTATDNLPANVTFIPGTMRSGTTCAGASDVEDNDATGADETNPFGMSTDTYIVNGSAPTLAPGGTFAMVFDVLVEPAPLP